MNDPAVRVLVVDDMPGNVVLIERILSGGAFDVRSTLDPDEAISLIRSGLADVVVLDVRMPARDGFDICRQLKDHQVTRLVPIILVTAEYDAADRLRAIEAGADDFIAKPLNGVELKARVRSLARVKRFTDDLESAEQVILSLALTIEARDAYTDGHCQRLAQYATRIGQAMRLSAADLRTLQRGGFLHDLGKIAIPDAVLMKGGPLSSEEFAVIKTHPAIGERLCGQLRSLTEVRAIVRSHHERRDGSGYPDGLGGDEIPLLAQIMGLVDVYDALTTTRPYRAALPAEETARILRAEAARGWHRRDLADLLLDLATAGELSLDRG